MSDLVYRIASLLGRVLQSIPVGTNLGLFHLFWMLLSGRLLSSRGAVIPGLADLGLPTPAARRSWAALAYGRWEAASLMKEWQALVQEEGRWQAHAYEGYQPVACDLVGFYRPRLKGCPTRHYASIAGKALPALSFGLLVSVGSVGGQRLALPRALVRSDPSDPREVRLMELTLRQAKAALKPKEILVCDRGFPLALLQKVGIERYLVRSPQNFTARRAALSPYKGHGRHAEYGEIVRPLARIYNGRGLPATPPDRVETWEEGTLHLRAEVFEGLVRSDEKAGEATFRCVVIHDPRYAHPLVLCVPVEVSGSALRSLYRDRWPIEGLPLAAKQMIGAARQFVSAEESCQRLPELSLIAGAILAYVAATEKPFPAGAWDRSPRPTSGRLRRVLSKVHFSDLPEPGGELREKRPPTDHLPKGIDAHRRQKREAIPPVSQPSVT